MKNFRYIATPVCTRPLMQTLQFLKKNSGAIHYICNGCFKFFEIVEIIIRIKGVPKCFNSSLKLIFKNVNPNVNCKNVQKLVGNNIILINRLHNLYIFKLHTEKNYGIFRLNYSENVSACCNRIIRKNCMREFLHIVCGKHKKIASKDWSYKVMLTLEILK